MYEHSRVETVGGGNLGIAGSQAFVATVGGLVLAAGAALALVRLVGDNRFVSGLEAATGALAFGGVIAVPGVLALLGLADRPVLLLPAGILLIPLSAVSFAGVTLPLLIPAVMLLVAYGRRSSGRPSAYPGQAGVCVVVVLVLVVLAFLVLFAHDDPRSYSTPTGGGSTSDVVTVAEAMLSLALSTTAVASAWLLARPYT